MNNIFYYFVKTVLWTWIIGLALFMFPPIFQFYNEADSVSYVFIPLSITAFIYFLLVIVPFLFVTSMNK